MRRSLFTSNDRMCGPPEFDLVPTHPKAGCVGAPYSPSPSGSARFLAAAARALGACLYVGSRRRGYSTAAPFKGCSMVKIDRMDNVLKDHRHPRLAPRKYIDGFRFPFSTFRVQRQRHHDFGFGDAVERIAAVHSHTSKNGMCGAPEFISRFELLLSRSRTSGDRMCGGTTIPSFAQTYPGFWVPPVRRGRRPSFVHRDRVAKARARRHKDRAVRAYGATDA
jgi:hypothetical protein